MKFDILGVGNALVDETFYVEREFVDSAGLNFNSFKPFRVGSIILSMIFLSNSLFSNLDGL